MSHLYKWELIDSFILDTLGRLDEDGNMHWVGSTYDRGDVRSYFRERGWETEVGDALQAHREANGRRAFSSRRVGMGPNAYYVVTEDTQRRAPGAKDNVVAMHRQQAQEMVDRWASEFTHRMDPLTLRRPAARKAILAAKSEMKLVAEVLRARLDEIEDEDEE